MCQHQECDHENRHKLREQLESLRPGFASHDEEEIQHARNRITDYLLDPVVNEFPKHSQDDAKVDTGEAILRFITHVYYHDNVVPDCPICFLAKSVRRERRQRPLREFRFVDLKISSIVPRGGKTRLHIPHHELSLGEVFEIQESNCSPSLDTRRDSKGRSKEIYASPGSKKEHVIGHFEIIDAGTIEITRPTDTAGDRGTLILRRCRLHFMEDPSVGRGDATQHEQKEIAFDVKTWLTGTDVETQVFDCFYPVKDRSQSRPQAISQAAARLKLKPEEFEKTLELAEDKVVLRMRFIEGMMIKEIADVMGVGRDKVGDIGKRAIGRLQKKLSPDKDRDPPDLSR